MTWDYLCATGNYNHAAMQQSASSQGVPASLSDSSFPLAASRKIEAVYEKWKEGGKCRLSSVLPPGPVPAPVPRIKTSKPSIELPTQQNLCLHVKSSISMFLRFITNVGHRGHPTVAQAMSKYSSSGLTVLRNSQEESTVGSFQSSAMHKCHSHQHLQEKK